MKASIEKKEGVSEYPVLKKGTFSGVIVLFVSPKEGFVVGNNSKAHKLGDYSDEWGELNFKEFNDKVILEN